MNKKLLYIGITLLIVGMIIAPVSAIVTPPTTFKDIFFKGIWTAIMDLQKQITNIKTTPGPTGPTGPAGAQGSQGLAGVNGKDGATVHLGEYANYDHDTIYTAETDGFVFVEGDYSGDWPTPAYAYFDHLVEGNVYNSRGKMKLSPGSRDTMTVPVKAGTTWEVNTNGYEGVNPFQVFWIPLTP